MPACLLRALALALLSSVAPQEPAPEPVPEPAPEQGPPGESPPVPAAETPPADSPPAEQPPAEGTEDAPVVPPPEAEELPAEAPASEATWMAAWNEELTRRAANDFQLCDLDGNGWIAFREAAQALELGREEFRRHDLDRDGRLDAAEFEARFRLLMERVGRVGPPRIGLPDAFAASAGEEDEAEVAGVELTPLDVLRRFDADGSRGLGLTEVARVFDELEVGLDPRLLVQQMDANTSAQLEIDELAPVTALVSRRLAERRVGSAAPGPRWAPRPLPRTSFERLDVDGDGSCSAEELRELVAPARLEVRAVAVVAALDRDGNGAIEASEFRASMER